MCCSRKDEREISYVDESVVERSEDAGDAKDKFCESKISLKEMTADCGGLDLSYRLIQASFQLCSPSEERAWRRRSSWWAFWEVDNIR